MKDGCFHFLALVIGNFDQKALEELSRCPISVIVRGRPLDSAPIGRSTQSVKNAQQCLLPYHLCIDVQI
jgi:hypothetical protein